MFTHSIFNIVSVIYGIIAIKLIWTVWKSRTSLFDHRVTAADQTLASQIAFYWLWPIAVLLHEGGHAVFAKMYGDHHITLAQRTAVGFQL